MAGRGELNGFVAASAGAGDNRSPINDANGLCRPDPAASMARATGITLSTVAAMPQSATFMADVPEANGTMMVMAIAVAGDKVVAFTTDGVKDEAYFTGTQKDGT